ncbi:ABC transporter permease [Streptomyces alkaliphilus]|uniref:ABC transporter permease n=1 Tax=Streptomyces alkaliphilus TaxID=1472722 RepID=UPI0011803DAF|nr:ABC transporter permease [Streptomyces alkaliphilus]MQS07005.1 ABC transporter permease subunit [Streptomyces alkaliphilus]
MSVTTQKPAGRAPAGPRPYHPTVARLTRRALLGRRRALLLLALPALLLLIAALIRIQAGVDDRAAVEILNGFALAAMVPLIGVIAGTGAIAPEIDDGSIAHLLATPVRRSTIILTKLVVAVGVTLLFTVPSILIAGVLLNENNRQVAVAFATAAAVASVAYGAIFLMLGVISRNAVVIGLIYALVWEALFGQLVPGAQTLSVQQWSLSIAQRIAEGGTVTSEVSLGVGVTLLCVTTAGATWYAMRRLRSLTMTGD